MFKVGDKVEVIDSFSTKRKGQLGVIVSINSGLHFPITVRFNTPDEDYDREEIFRAKDITIAKNQIVREIINDL